MYSLTLCVRVTTPPQYGRNGMAHAAAASILSQTKRVFASMRLWLACGGPGGLPLGSATHFHTGAIATQPVHHCKSAQYCTTRWHRLPLPKLHPGLCSSVGMWRRTDRHTDKHTDARDHNTFLVVYNSREM